MNRFIKIFAVLFVSVLTFSISACKKDKAEVAEAQITKAIAKLKLPKKLDDGSTWTECYYADKVLTIRCEMDKNKLAKLDAEKHSKATAKRLKNDLFNKPIVKNLVDANASIKYVYYNGSDSISFTFGPKELETTD